jgi:hypothetical protein
VYWRKCLVRGLVFSALGAFAIGGWLYQRLTCSSAVQEQVIAKLESLFRASHVSLEAANLRLLGGISFSELRLTRISDPEKNDLIYVPSGIIFHDKEQLLDGKLAIRKLELNKPRLHFIRQRDGTWNSANILGPVDLGQMIPTVVIRKGTIILEDRLATPDAAPVEFKNVNLTLINDPQATLAIHLQGAADLLGVIEATASFQRATSALELTLDAPAMPIGATLVQRLAGYCPSVGDYARELQGAAHLRVELAYDPAAERPWTHNVFCRLTKGKWHHAAVPLPLEDMEAEVRWSTEEGVRLKKLTAQAGSAHLELTGSARDLYPQPDFEGRLHVTDLPVNAELFARLPETLRHFQDEYSPIGVANLDLDVARVSGQWRRHSIITTNKGQARYVKFAYPLEQIRGRIEDHLDEAEHIHERRFDLVGLGAAARPVHVQGTVTGEGPNPAVNIDIWGWNLPLDETLLSALAEKHQKIARSFHATGQGDFDIQIRRAAGQERFANHVKVRVHDGTARYDVFPYPLEGVSGVLEIYPDHFEFRDFRGTHKGGEFLTWGKSQPDANGRDRIGISIRGNNILLDDELEAALSPKLRAAWKSLALGGRLSLEAEIDQLPDRPEDIDVMVAGQGCTVRPVFFPYLLSDVSGTVHYAHGRVDIQKIAGRHGNTQIGLERGQIFLKPAGGFWARLENLHGQPVIVDADFEAALPAALKKISAIAAPGTPVAFASDLVVDMPSEPNLPPDIYWDGGLSVKDAALQAGVALENVRGQFWCQGRFDGRQLVGIKGNLLLDQAVLFRQPLRTIHSHVLVTPEAPDVLRLPDLKARFMGGDVGGELRVEFGPTLHYNVNLTALQIHLEEFGRNNLGPHSDWEGLASARLYLSGHGSDIHGLEGHGSIDVPSGKMYNLPLLLDLIKMLGLRPPDRTAFEEAHAAFSIKGPRVAVSRLDLDGNAISLSGQGEMNLDGTDLQLDFYAVWGRIKQILPPIFREIPPALGQQLLKIKMRGQMNEVKITKEPVPVLIEPIERLLKRFGDRSGDNDQPAPSATNAMSNESRANVEQRMSRRVYPGGPQGGN